MTPTRCQTQTPDTIRSNITLYSNITQYYNCHFHYAFASWDKTHKVELSLKSCKSSFRRQKQFQRTNVFIKLLYLPICSISALYTVQYCGIILCQMHRYHPFININSIFILKMYYPLSTFFTPTFRISVAFLSISVIFRPKSLFISDPDLLPHA